ncbi:MAG: thiamine phosphate synthase [Nitrospinota bacterium]|nr:thiamine phosphate synthase [Nitrospinota bacterium]
MITDRLIKREYDLFASLDAAFSGGVRFLQFREKDLPANERFLLGKEVKELSDLYKVKFIVNGDPSLALALGADGVHLGRNTLPIRVVRGKLKFKGIIGYSAHSVEEVRDAFNSGADYVTLSPIFESISKTTSVPSLGLEIFKNEVSYISGPVYALGGISPVNALGCINAGAYGVAVVGAILGTDDPSCSAKEILNIISC